MSVQPNAAADLDSVFEAIVDSQMDALNNLSRGVWKAQVESAKQHLDAIAEHEEVIRKHQSSLEASVSIA
jgi:hypothetical protein